MAAKEGISSVQPKNSNGFMTVLSYAVCEWFLIFMLFIDAGLSYLLTKFAWYCDLQTPCPLCSRIDLVFEKRKPGYYRSLLCSGHREDISCLVKCHNHDKLADVHVLCEDCIASFVKSIKSSSESYRLVLDKFGADIEESGQKKCSCCSKILRATPKAERLLQVTPVGFGASKANVKPPLPRAPGRSRFSRRNSLKRLRDKFAGPNSPRSTVSTGVDRLSHVGYMELKITSESESEVPISDDGYSTSASCRRSNRNAEFYTKEGSQKLPKEVTDDGYSTSASYRRSNRNAESYTKEGSQKLPKEVTDESGPKKPVHQSSEHLPSLLDVYVLPESSEHNSRNSLAPGASLHHGLGELNWDYPIAKPSTSAFPELISLDDALQDSASTKHKPKFSTLPELDPNHALSSFSSKEGSEISRDHTGNINSRNTSLAKTTETGILANENHAQSNHGNSLDKLISTDRDPSSNETIPGVHVDVLQRSGSGSSDAIDMIQVAATLVIDDTCHDTLDSISVKEIEGESVLERLKRQVDYDRSCMKALFKELEEERNAAAVAANQTMAMITRLQEEKASLHMEALQYLRMMEEQAEYDMEALEKANELLSEREKEIQDLEAELENYRYSYLDEPMADGSHEETSNVGDSHVENGPSLRDDLNSAKLLTANFECEKVYISEYLQLLEKKLHEHYTNGELVSSQKSEHFDEITSDRKETSPSNPSQVSNSADLVMENHLEEKNHIDGDRHNLSSQAIEVNIDSFRRAITDLKDRLQALEVDRYILKLALDSLQNGNEGGLQFIQEISHQLQELRNIVH